MLDFHTIDWPAYSKRMQIAEITIHTVQERAVHFPLMLFLVVSKYLLFH